MKGKYYGIIKKSNNKEKIINKVARKTVRKINKLDSGTETAMCDLWEDEIKIYELDDDDLFDIFEKIWNICKEKNIKLNTDKFKGLYGGLPYNLPFIKE